MPGSVRSWNRGSNTPKPLWTQSTRKLGVTPDKLKQLQKGEFGYDWFFQETTSRVPTRRKTKQKRAKNKETATVSVDLKVVGWADSFIKDGLCYVTAFCPFVADGQGCDDMA